LLGAILDLGSSGAEWSFDGDLYFSSRLEANLISVAFGKRVIDPNFPIQIVGALNCDLSFLWFIRRHWFNDLFDSAWEGRAGFFAHKGDLGYMQYENTFPPRRAIFFCGAAGKPAKTR
jgi:hypothetical protein